MKRIVVQRLIRAPVQILRALAFSASLLIGAMPGDVRAQSADANDTARLLAGMQPSPPSPVLALTKEQAWQHHANRLNAIFAQVESRQLARIRTWSRMKLNAPSPVLFYMFSGPDFLYASAFFPNASTYVMSGLEPTGPIPDLTKLSRESLAHGLRNIEESLSSILICIVVVQLQSASSLTLGDFLRSSGSMSISSRMMRRLRCSSASRLM